MRFAAVAILVLLAAPQEKVTLKVNLKAGDAVEISQTTTQNITVTVQGTEAVQDIKGTLRQSWKILESKEGRIAKAEVETPEESVEVSSPMLKDPMKMTHGLNGTKATVTRTDSGFKIEGADSLSEADRGRLDLDQFALYFPANEVAVGESWEVKGDALKRSLSSKEFTVTAAKAACTLKAVGEVDGMKCAILTVKLQFKGTMDQQGMTFDAKVDMDGEVACSIDRGVPVSSKFTGNISFADDGGLAEGKGTMNVNETRKVK